MYNYNDAVMRLRGCFFSHNDQVVVVHSVEEDTNPSKLWLRKVREAFLVEQEELDLTPLPLGFCGHDGALYYMKRKPVRRWKRGLNPRVNMEMARVRREDGRVIPMAIPGVIREYLQQIYDNDYMSVEEVMKLPSVMRNHPISRKFAISKTKLLYRNGLVVGTAKRGKLALMDEYKYLQQILDEVNK